MWLTDTVEKMMIVTGRDPVRAPIMATPKRRMLSMAELFGLTEAQLFASPQRAKESLDACAACDCAEACERFRNGQGASFVPAVCPNRETFKELAV